MVFRRNIEPSCSYCLYSTDIGRYEIVCTIRGIMASHGSCGAFRYEPTKREPEFARSLNRTGVNKEDFLL